MAFNDDILDLEALHDFFWKYSDSKGKVKFTITEMSELFGMTYYSMSRVLGKFVKAGRLKKKSPRGSEFYCVDPFTYRMNNGVEIDPRRKDK